tara:strand:- start:84 stop:764 length:681 start_codon:yes stop_codon:yes gene_type:complete
MARGTGPKRNPNKITIGDGSISDLIKFLVGEDLPIKRGNQVVSKETIEKEIPKVLDVESYKLPQAEIDRRVASRGPYPEAYNIKTDYKGTYSPANMRARAQRAEAEKVDSAGGYFPTNVSGKRMGEFEGAVPLLSQRVYGNRRYDPMPRRNTQTYPIVERKQEPVNENKFNIRPVDQSTGGYTEGMGMMNMGGYVQPKKKKKKKKMYGGKMKKYAKGGGIRKPKYS